MIVITPRALAESGYERCTLGTLKNKDAHEAHLFVFPSPDPIHSQNGDGELYEVHDVAADYSWISTDRGEVRKIHGLPVNADTIVHFRRRQPARAASTVPADDIDLRIAVQRIAVQTHLAYMAACKKAFEDHCARVDRLMAIFDRHHTAVWNATTIAEVQRATAEFNAALEGTTPPERPIADVVAQAQSVLAAAQARQGPSIHDVETAKRLENARTYYAASPPPERPTLDRTA